MRSVSGGAVTVLNAIPCGIGAAIGVDLRTEAVFEVVGDSREVVVEGAPGTDDTMVRICVREAYGHEGIPEPEGWRLTVSSMIPMSRGLKSSSSACNAVLGAVLGEIGSEMSALEAVSLGTGCAVEAGVSVTGAFDDACGCAFGGLVMTDNASNSVVFRREIGRHDVVIHVPERTIEKRDVPAEALRSKGRESRMIAGLVASDPFRAMTENGRLVADALGLDNSLAERAVELGALGAGITGTGPATAAVVPEGTGPEFAERLGLDPEETIITVTT